MEIEKQKQKQINIVYLNPQEIEERIKQRITELLSNIKVPRDFATYTLCVINDDNRRLHIRIYIYHYRKEWHQTTSFLPANSLPTKEKNIYKAPRIVSRADFNHIIGSPSVSYSFRSASVSDGFNNKTVAKYKSFYTEHIYDDYYLSDINNYCKIKESKWK